MTGPTVFEPKSAVDGVAVIVSKHTFVSEISMMMPGGMFVEMPVKGSLGITRNHVYSVGNRLGACASAVSPAQWNGTVRPSGGRRRSFASAADRRQLCDALVAHVLAAR